MEELIKKIDAYKNEIDAYALKNGDSAESFRIKYLGTKGLIKSVMSEMKNVPAENKKAIGQIVNDLKLFTENKYEELKLAADQQPTINDKFIDLTLPGDPLPLGTRHPVSLVRNRIISIFQRLGFAVAEGPEIEDDWHNFTALNLPQDHPARDMQDTFYVSGFTSGATDWMLRTHTSSVQVREMEKG